MGNRILKQNMLLLQQHHPASYQVIQALDVACVYQYCNAHIHMQKNGFLSLRINNSTIHSLRNPIKEAQRIIHKLPSVQSSCALVLGFGLGYHIDAYIKQYSKSTICVIEPNPYFFYYACMYRDFHSLLTYPSLHIIFSNNPHYIHNAIQRYNSIQLVILHSLVSIHHEIFSSIINYVQQQKHNSNVNTNTLKKFSTLWVRNLFANSYAITQRTGIMHLTDCAKDIPILLLAGGPSLDDIRHLVPKLAKRMLIVAVDTALSFTKAIGVEPDIIVIIDPQYWNTCHVHNIATTSIIIAESSTNPRIFRLFKKNPIYLCDSIFPLGHYLQRSHLTKKGHLAVGGSVSTSAWDFARLIGAKHIYCAGLDLGYPNMHTHYQGSYFEERMHTKTCRTHPVHTMNITNITSGNPISCLNYAHTKTLSDERMHIYIQWFTQQFSKYPQIHNYALSKNSIAIQNMNYVDPLSLMQLPIIRTHINQSLRYYKNPRNSLQCNNNQTHTITTELIINLIQSMQNIVQLTNTGLHILNQPLTSEILAQLHAIDNQLLANQHTDIISFLMQDKLSIQHFDYTNTDKMSMQDILRYNHTLYQGIQQSCRYHITIMQKFV